MAHHHIIPNRLQPDSTPTDAKTGLKKTNKTKPETPPDSHILRMRLLAAWVCVCVCYTAVLARFLDGETFIPWSEDLSFL